MWTLIGYAVCYIVGSVVVYFVMKNNPKYFNIADMLKAKKAELLAKLNAKKDMTIDEVKKLIDKVI
jgi:hypothetical protein